MSVYAGVAPLISSMSLIVSVRLALMAWYSLAEWKCRCVFGSVYAAGRPVTSQYFRGGKEEGVERMLTSETDQAHATHAEK